MTPAGPGLLRGRAPPYSWEIEAPGTLCNVMVVVAAFLSDGGAHGLFETQDVFTTEFFGSVGLSGGDGAQELGVFADMIFHVG